MSNPLPSPITLEINVRRLPRKGQMVIHPATEEERAEIARQNDLIEVTEFRGECLLAPWKRDGVQLSGRVKAKIIQPCAVTLAPLNVTIDEPFEAIFVPDGSKLSKPRVNEEGEILLDPEGDDLPETFIGDSINVGDVWMEFLLLAIDPFLRSPHAQPLPEKGISTAGDETTSPFAILSTLKKH